MGSYAGFPRPIPHLGARTNVLLALSPLSPLAGFSCDLHVLAMPPAFNLSQDQTLQLIFVECPGRIRGRFSKKFCLATTGLRRDRRSFTITGKPVTMPPGG